MLVLCLADYDKSTVLGAPHDEAIATVQRDGACVLGVDAKIDLRHAEGLPCVGQHLFKKQGSKLASSMLGTDVHAPEIGLVAELGHGLPLEASQTSKFAFGEYPKDGA